MSGIRDGRTNIAPLPPRHVSRPRLLAALDAALSRPVTLVAAGPGWGKTVLLSEWAAARRPRPAWVSLEPGDNEPSRLWATVATALAVAELPGAPAAAPPEAVSDVLRAALGNPGVEPVVLVLDDAHLITDPVILARLDDAVRRWPHRLRLMLSARSDPLLPLHRYRTTGRLSEIRAGDLAMTVAETARLLAVHGVRLCRQDLRRLAARAEGWPAGVRLSAMGMEGAARPAEFVTDFALDRGSAGEYLIEEVLERQPPDVRRLLIETAFLDVVDGSLAAAVTGLTDAGRMLEELARTNSFVLPIDPAAGTYRCHHLMAEILRFLLRREPEKRRVGLARAARWYFDHDDIGKAVRYALDADDLDYAAATLVTGGLVRALVEQVELPTEAADRFAHDPAGGGFSPDRLLAAAALHALAGRPAAARRCLAALGEAPLHGEHLTTRTVIELLLARAMRYTDPLDAQVRRLIELGSPDELIAVGRLEQAMGHFYAADADPVEPALVDAAARAHAAGNATLELTCVAQLALCYACWGRFLPVRDMERRANLLLVRNAGLRMPAQLLYASAVRHFTAGEFDAAREVTRRAAIGYVQQRDHDLRNQLRLLEIMDLALQGRLAEALDKSADLAGADGEVGDLVSDYRAFVEANLEIAAGRPARVVERIDEIGGPPSDLQSLALGRALLALGDLDRAALAVRPMTGNGRRTRHRPILVDALVADAQIAVARTDGETRAVASLSRALDLAGDDVVVPFVPAEAALAELCARHPGLAKRWPRFHSPRTAGPRVPTGAGAITDRERTVLRWLATTMSTAEIAEEMCLSVNTVKTHSASIYRKLGATRRRDAVLRARRLELL